jgi:hypothetical protein
MKILIGWDLQIVVVQYHPLQLQFIICRMRTVWKVIISIEKTTFFYLSLNSYIFGCFKWYWYSLLNMFFV